MKFYSIWKFNTQNASPCEVADSVEVEEYSSIEITFNEALIQFESNNNEEVLLTHDDGGESVAESLGDIFLHHDRGGIFGKLSY